MTGKLSILRRRLDRRAFLSSIGAVGALAASRVDSRAQRKGERDMTGGKDSGRLEPLFRSEADAREVITKYCMGDADEPLTAGQRDILLSRLLPQMWLAPSDAETATLGTTRLGGAPDLPKGTAWPMRSAEPELSKAAASSSHPNPWVVRQLAETVPFEFIGQIDLGDATSFPKHVQGLPSVGRLYFFLDVAMQMHGPSSGPQACKVSYDTSPIDGLERLTLPAKFDEMENWWRTPDPNQIKVRADTERILKDMLRDFEAKGQTEEAQSTREALSEIAKPLAPPDPNLKKPFLHPPRAKRIEPLFVLPKDSTIEFQLDAELKSFAGNREGHFDEHYSLLTSNDMGPFTTDPSGLRRTQAWLTMEARRNRLMGPPEPEQDDPRYGALPESDLPPYPWNEAQTHQMALKATAWQMLLQVSMADLSQVATEGTVYFIIHKDDLAKRDFSRVTAVYQQT